MLTSREVMEACGFATGLSAIAVFVLLLGMVGTAQNRYTLDGTVVKTEDSVMTVEDSRGHLWATDVDGGMIDKNAEIKIVFDTNGTDNIITDDRVVRIER